MEIAEFNIRPEGSIALDNFLAADSTISTTTSTSETMTNSSSVDSGSPPLNSPNEPTEEEDSDIGDAADVETIRLKQLGGADAESIFQVSMSRAASRIQSARTPAAERAAALDQLTNGDYFVVEDSDEGSDTPKLQEAQEMGTQTLVSQPNHYLQPAPSNRNAGKSTSPTSKATVSERSEESRSALKDALSFSARRRSLSESAENLKKLLPKGLPSLSSLPKASSLIPSLPSPSFFGGQKKSSSNTSSRERSASRCKGSVSPRLHQHDSSTGSSSPREPSPTSTQPNSTDNLVQCAATCSRPALLRRASSHESLLYHSISRASSLGDDSRFESHRVQVNSRAKAIRDSIQDRSTFRMPQVSMPSMPHLPMLLRRHTLFGLAHLSLATLQNNRANTKSQDILPVGQRKKPQNSATFPVLSPGLASASIARPELSIDPPQPHESAAQILEHAIEGLTGDVVILGGYRGSILRDTKTKRRVWVTQKVGVNMRRVNLEVGLNDEDEERMEETIYPDGMLKNIGPVDISRRLFKRLRESPNAKNGTLRVWDYGYDWRLSPHLLSRKLVEFLKGLPSNQPGGSGALVLAHSLGGLITRHAVNQHPDLFSGVVYAGVPQACVNILGPFHNGDAVLFSQRVLTAQVNFTLRTSFLLLPTNGYCFINIKNPKEEYPVDFFNVDDWIKYRWSPCTDPPLPPKNPPNGLTSLINFSGNLPSLPLLSKKIEGSEANHTTSHDNGTSTTAAANKLRELDHGKDRTLAPQMGNLSNPAQSGQSTNSSVSTHVTLPREKCIEYLSRILPQIKRFKQETHHNPEHEKANRYPPIAVLYGKNIPTVYGAKVDGEDAIPCADVYENLSFASGDGVVLAKMAMVPRGYRVVGGGRVSSERGHVTLLGDLAAVGKCIAAVRLGRERGIGLGPKDEKSNP